MEVLSKNNPVFAAYAFYTAILVVKLILMAPLTARQRLRKKVFANPEDAKSLRGSKVSFDDPDVERVRRAHLNDLENIPAFIFIAFLYLWTSPNEFLALQLFRAFVAARILHTIVYAIVPLPQPARGLSFGVGIVITVYMASQVILTFVL